MALLLRASHRSRRTASGRDEGGSRSKNAASHLVDLGARMLPRISSSTPVSKQPPPGRNRGLPCGSPAQVVHEIAHPFEGPTSKIAHALRGPTEAVESRAGKVTKTFCCTAQGAPHIVQMRRQGVPGDPRGDPASRCHGDPATAAHAALLGVGLAILWSAILRATILRAAILLTTVLWAAILLTTVLWAAKVVWTTVLWTAKVWTTVLRAAILRTTVLRAAILRTAVLRTATLRTAILRTAILRAPIVHLLRCLSRIVWLWGEGSHARLAAKAPHSAGFELATGQKSSDS